MKRTLIYSLAILFLAGCNVNALKKEGFSSAGDSSGDSGSTSQSSTSTGNSPVVAGEGGNFAGTGGITVPVADATVARLQNALGIKSTAGNFAKALLNLRPNLMKVTDPTQANGYDQVQLLVYAACSDLTTGGTAAPMLTTYKITAKNTVTQSQTALIAAGVSMLDKHMAGLASQGPTSAQVSTVFTNLLTTLETDSTNTSTIAFMSVCMAANTAALTLMGQ